MIGDRTRPSKLRNVIVLDIEGQRICILQASVLPTRPLCVLLACSLVSPEVKVKQIVKAALGWAGDTSFVLVWSSVTQVGGIPWLSFTPGPLSCSLG